MEKTLVLQELKGSEGLGFYYSLTDRAPKPGEYGYLTQGMSGAGNLLFTFTILHRAKNAPERGMGLDLLRSARQKAQKGD